MNKTELIEKMAAKAGTDKKAAGALLNAFMESVKEELAGGGSIQLVGFGTFTVSKRAERQGKNPATGEAMIIPASKSVKFKAGNVLKTAVQKSISK